MTRAAVFLDRDGVINRAFIREGTPYPPVSLRDLEILPHVPEALSALKAHGYSLVVVTNQPDVARGTASRELVDSIHERLKGELGLDAILPAFMMTSMNATAENPSPDYYFGRHTT